MARTIVSKPGPIRKSLKKKWLLEQVYEQLKISQGDFDKASEIGDWNYYEGWRDALTWVIKLMTKIVKEEKAA